MFISDVKTLIEHFINMEKGVWRCLEGGWNFGCAVSGGFEKSVRSRGRKQNLAITLRASLHDLHQLALQRSQHLSYKCNKNQLCDYLTTEPAGLAETPVSRYRNPGWEFSKQSHLLGSPANEPGENRTVGNTLLIRTASRLYVKMVALGWLGPCNTEIKAPWQS